jgi:hypothetical protein
MLAIKKFETIDTSSALQLPEQLQKAWSNLGDYPIFYRQFIENLLNYQPQIKNSEFRFALVTILALAILEKEVDHFIDMSDEVERHEKITQYVYLRAELAFSSGNNPEEIKKSILQRVEDVKRVYLKAQERGCLKSFFQDGFTGPPCFNGRLLSIQEYENTQLDLIPFSWGKTAIDKEAVEVEEWIYEYQNSNQTEKVPCFEEFIKYFNIQQKMNHFRTVFDRACEIYHGGKL